jgi:hypothetical protein
MADIAYTPEANAGWIAVARSMRSHPVVGFGKSVPGADPKRGAFSRAEAWLDLIMMAQHKVSTWINKGRKTELQVGQLPGAYSFLAERWNWTVKTVRNFLARLLEEGMLDKPSADQTASETGKQRGNQVQLLTISNYSTYQIAREIEGIQKGQARGKRGASEGQQLNNVTIKQEDRSADADSSTAEPIDMFARAESMAAERAGTGRKIAAVAVGLMTATMPAAAATPPMEPPAHHQQQLPGVPAPAQKTLTRAEAIAMAVEEWNGMAERCGLSKVRILSDARKSALMLRIKEAGNYQAWAEAIRKVENSPFLRGENKDGWRATFDFTLQPSSFAKLLEGAYDRNGTLPRAPAMAGVSAYQGSHYRGKKM